MGRNAESWNVVIGRDIIIPVMNVTNPLKDEILKIGLTQEKLIRILNNPEKQNWEELTGHTKDEQNIPLHCYITDNPIVLTGVAKFLKTGNVDKLIKSGSEKEMISAIQKDPNAMGFCRLIQILDANNQNLPENIQLIPIDKNGNGKIDYMEDIYENLQAFYRGVWIGKYPATLSRKIYVVASYKPENKAELAFLNWVLTDGQKSLASNGYSEIMPTERLAQLAKINDTAIDISSGKEETHASLKLILLILLVISVFSISWILLSRQRSTKTGTLLKVSHGSPKIFDENSVIVPKGLYFDKTHTWAFMKKDGTVKIGIDDFLQHVTGPITRIKMKKSGEKIRKGEPLLTLNQKGKQLNIYSPVSGTIKERNENLKSDSTLLNSAPYEAGWIYSLEPKNLILEDQFLSIAEKIKNELKK